jgi:diadenosine tetraphosphate (Ap4A) HIT family hydrolase
MKDKLPKPHKDSMIYEDRKLYACLASHPKTRGHSIVAWKKNVPDLRYLSDSDYDYLMDKVDQVRDALIKTLKIKKVYLVYLDEVKHVHWHLIPRYNERGYDVLAHKPKKLKNFSLAKKIKNNLRVDK